LVCIQASSRQIVFGVVTVFVTVTCAEYARYVLFGKGEETFPSKKADMSLDRRIEVGSRLALAVRDAGGNAFVSQRVGISTRSISRYIAGEVEMPFLTAVEIAAVCGKSLNWLLYGRDDATFGDAVTQSAPATTLIPLLNVVGSAGPGFANGDVEIIDRLPFSRTLLRRLGVNPDKAQFITHSGDSMVPTLADGGVCLIDTARNHPAGDGIYALMVGDELLVKRLAFGAKGLTLISDNADKYPPETLTGDELDRVKIMGKVFWTGGGV
jgi:phage repressor protein C with HTH and peptisase S24 domain